MFASLPGHLPDEWGVTKPVTQMDLAATAIARAGEKIDEKWPIDGANLMPFLDGKNTALLQLPICWSYENRQWAIREGGIKLVERSMQPKIKAEVGLYELKEDPMEANDL